MASWKRRILGVAVISAGACAALPFRNAAVNAPSDVHNAAESPGAVTPRNELTLQLTIPTTPVAVPTNQGEREAQSAAAKTMPAPQPQEVRRDELQAPPSIAAAFQPLAATSPAATEEATPTTNTDEPQQRHRIADGDTLEAIAEHYLGNRDQWLSIFEANDGLLTDRNILPIGKEILIPQVRRPSHDDTDDHLVPIPVGLLNSEG